MKSHNLAFLKSGRNRPFGSVLLTYLLLLALVLPLLVIGYSYSIQQTIQDVEAMQISFLGQVRQELDIRLRSVSRVSQFLASYPLTQTVSAFRDERADYQLDYQKLDEIISEQNVLLSGEGITVVYFDASDSILTGEHRYRSVNLDAFTGKIGLSPEEFRDFLPQQVSRGGVLKILHPGTADAKLVYMIPIVDDACKKVGTILTEFSMSYLKESINASHWREGTICHMQNEKEILSMDNGGFGDAVLSSDMPDYQSVPLDASPVTLNMNGKKYLTVGMSSTERNWNYYFSVPIDELMKAHKVYLLMFAAALFLSILIGIALSLHFSKKVSHPIQALLTSMALNSTVGYREAIASLESAMVSYQKDMSAVRSQAMQKAQREKADFVYGLCSGRISPGLLEAGAARHGFSLGKGPLSLIVFQYKSVEGSVFIQDGFLDQDMLLYASENVVEELLCPNQGVAVVHGKELICLYQPSGPVDEEALRTALEKIADFHRDVLNVDMLAFYAGRGAGLEDLPELLSVAEEMSRYKIFWEDDVPDILFASETGDLSSLDRSASLGVEKRFLNLLAIENYEEAYEVLMEKLNSGVSRDFRRFQREKYQIYGLISSLLETVSVSTADDGDRLQSALNSLLSEQSLSRLKEKVDFLFRHIIAAQQEKARAMGPVSWVPEVQRYIEAHYADPQMDVSHLAKEFSLNVSHLSRTYKKVTSIGVLDNIHMVRIAKAKSLLNQGRTVQETSAMVGYMEPRALIRAFKRYEGITPGQFQGKIAEQG